MLAICMQKKLTEKDYVVPFFSGTPRDVKRMTKTVGDLLEKTNKKKFFIREMSFSELDELDKKVALAKTFYENIKILFERECFVGEEFRYFCREIYQLLINEGYDLDKMFVKILREALLEHFIHVRSYMLACLDACVKKENFEEAEIIKKSLKKVGVKVFLSPRDTRNRDQILKAWEQEPQHEPNLGYLKALGVLVDQKVFSRYVNGLIKKECKTYLKKEVTSS